MKYKIYKLILNEQVVYVGITTDTLENRKKGGYKHTGCAFILKDASIELIEETDDRYREKFWIEYYRDLGINLYNKSILGKKGSIGRVSSYKSDDYNIIDLLISKLNK